MEFDEEKHNKCDVTGSTCGSSIGLGKHKSLSQCFKDKKDARIGIKRKRSEYEERILKYGKEYEICGVRMANYFWNVEYNTTFFYLPLFEGVDKRYGATPDGLIDSDGLLEVKCPWTKNIYEEIYEGSMPLDHYCQIQMELACTMRDYAVYLCWTPKETAIVKVLYNQEAWEDIYARIMIFSQYLNSKEEPSLKFKKGEKATLEKIFNDYVSKSIEYIYLIKASDNKAFWI